MRATRPADLILPGLITVIIFGEDTDYEVPYEMFLSTRLLLPVS
jgi:hypothetical protein